MGSSSSAAATAAAPAREEIAESWLTRDDPLSVADGDRRDFATIIASAKHATISFSRRDVEGRLLGRSPLIGDIKEI
jgi:hypothetical protein